MGKPPIKSTKALVKAKLTAEAKFYKSNEGREVWLRSQVERLIDKIDPLELMATVCGTFIIYDLIVSTPELMAEWRARVIIAASPALAFIIDKFLGGIQMTAEQKAQYEKIKNTPDFELYIKCFAISYVMIKHSGQIVNGVGNLTKFVAGMIGLDQAII